MEICYAYLDTNSFYTDKRFKPLEMDMRVLQESLRRYVESKEDGIYYNSDPEHFKPYLSSVYEILEKIAPEDIKKISQGVDKAMEITKFP